jgi:succinate dehydrogenase / fumarate reductase, cytochrome b subunit
VVLLYTVAMIAVGFHLRHGTWSALTTLGANVSSLARSRLNLLAYVVAGVVTIGFLLPPYAIVFGLVD